MTVLKTVDFDTEAGFGVGEGLGVLVSFGVGEGLVSRYGASLLTSKLRGLFAFLEAEAGAPMKMLSRSAAARIRAGCFFMVTAPFGKGWIPYS